MTLAIGWIDLTVLLGYLLAIVALGLWIGAGQRSVTAYLVGDRNLPWWAILGSIVATETSAVTFLSVPGLAFEEKRGNLTFLQLALGYLVGRVLVVWLLLPLYFRGQLFTAYQVLNERFGRMTHALASLIFLATRNVSDGLRLFLTAIVLNQTTGMSLPAAILAMGAATIVYTYVGGIRAVIWNDCIQLLVYVAGGMVALVAIVTRLPGGLTELMQFAEQSRKLQVFDFTFSLLPTFTFWSGLAGGMFLTLGTHGTDQMMVQRYLCARSQADAGLALVISGLVVLVQFALFLAVGVGLAAFYARFPPPVPWQHTDGTDEVFARFMVHQLPYNVGLIGLMLAAVFSVSMSTLSSSLNSSASSAAKDLLGLAHADEGPRALRQARLLTILFGAVQIVVAIVAVQLSNRVVDEVLAVAGFSAGLMLGVYLLGIACRGATQSSAVVALLVGLCVLLYVKFGTRIAWPWYALVGATVTYAAGCTQALLVQVPRRKGHS